MNTYVVSCKAKPPIAGGDVIAQQISLAHKYQCKMIELHRDFRSKREDSKRRHFPTLVTVESECDRLDVEIAEAESRIRTRNAATRSKTASPADREGLASLKTARKAARERRKQLREQARNHPAYQADLAALIVQYQGELIGDTDRRRGGHFKDARRDCGVYWGTYLRVEAAVEQTVQTTVGDFRFPRWTGDGRVGPQLVPPLSLSELKSGTDSRLRMEVDSRRATDSHRRSERVVFCVRIGSDGKEPVWAKIPAHISRGQLPDDAQIIWATIVRRQTGVRRHRDPDCLQGVYRPYYEWSVQLTIRTNKTKPHAQEGAAGINLGWRTQGNGSIRIATLADDSGHVEHLEMPTQLVRRFARTREIQEERSVDFDAMKLRLGKWLSEHSHPEWLREEIKGLHQWKSHRRLGRLVDRWCREPFRGDDAIVVELANWRAKETNLEWQELMLRKSAARWRRDIHRSFAARIRQRYRYVAVDDTEQCRLVRRPDADSNESVNQVAQYHAHIVAVSMLRSLLKQDGAVLVNPQDITRTCHQCGSLETFDQAENLTHTCEGCGAEWDQDVNAAKNLLARAVASQSANTTPRGPEGQTTEGVAESPSSSGGRWARRKADRSQRNRENAPG